MNDVPRGSGPLTSLTLLGRLQSASRDDGWMRFQDEYFDWMFETARQLARGDENAADELVADVLGKLPTVIPSLDLTRDGPFFRAYLATMLKNAHTDRFRSPHRARRTEVDPDFLAHSQDADAGGAEWLEFEEFRDLILDRARRIVERDFPEGGWTVWHEHIYNCMQAREVGERLGKSEAAIWAMAARIRKRLREELSDLRELFD